MDKDSIDEHTRKLKELEKITTNLDQDNSDVDENLPSEDEDFL